VVLIIVCNPVKLFALTGFFFGLETQKNISETIHLFNENKLLN